MSRNQLWLMSVGLVGAALLVVVASVQDPSSLNIAEGRYVAWLMTQGYIPYADVWSTASPVSLWIHSVVGLTTGFSDVATILWWWSLLLMPAAVFFCTGRTLGHAAGASALIFVLALMPRSLLLETHLIAGVFGSLSIVCSLYVRDAPSHIRAAAWSLICGLFGGLASLLCPWLLPVLWLLQIIWVARMHKHLRGMGWYGVRRVVHASIWSLMGLGLIVIASGLWLLFSNAWAGWQHNIQARFAAGWQLQSVSLDLPLSAGMLVVFVLAWFQARKASYWMVAMSVAALALCVCFASGDGAALLTAIPFLPLLWWPSSEPKAKDKSPVSWSAPMLCIAAILASLWGAAVEASTESDEGVQRLQGAERVIDRMLALEGAGNGAVITNGREYALLMRARRIPGTPFVDGDVVSESHTEASLRRLALNRVDAAHHNAPLWVVWNTRASAARNAMDANPTLSVWIRSNCIIAIPDELDYLAPYDLYYCGTEKDRFR